jgi:dipeptide/tripeptide permease
MSFGIFVIITLFHIYMGVGGRVNKAAILPTINHKDLPFHSAAAIPVAILLGISTIAFGQQIGIISPILSETFSQRYLWLSAFALISRGLMGLIIFHLLNKVIDPSLFKEWDLRLYSPLTLYLGIHCLIISM